MLQIRAVVGNDLVFLDLYQDEPVLMSISFAEIQNITTKNSTFSQTFQLPGTKVNNGVFDYYYDISSSPINFNPNNKFPAIITWDGVEIMQGNIRLESVSITKDEIVYSVVFYNQVGDVAANIGDKFMRQLDLSSLTHPLSDNVWLQSQIDYNLVPLTGTTNYSYQDGRTFWGLYQIGYNYTDSLSGLTNYYAGFSSTNVNIVRGSQTITTTTVLPFIPGDVIRMQNAVSGYYVEGTVTNVNGTSITFNKEFGLGTGTLTGGFINYIIPEGVQINDYDSTPQIAFQNPNVPNFFSFSGTPIRDFYFKPSIQVKELYTQIFNQAGYEVESKFFDTSYFERFYLPLKFNTQGVYSQGLVEPCYTFSFSSNTPNSGVTCNNVPFSADSQAIYIPSGFSGNYTFDVYLTYEDYFPLCGGSPGYYELYLSANNTTYLVSQVQDCDPDFPGTYQIQLGGRITVNITAPTSISLYPVVGGGTITGAGLQIQNAPRFAPLTGNYDYSLEFPPNDFKQIDFITSINKLFNLVVVPSPNEPDVLIVEPIIDYIGKGQVLDWTHKVDFGSPIQLKPTNSIINGTLNFNFRLDQDYVNQQFNISANRIFGTYEVQLNQDFKDAKTNFDPIFSSPVDITLNNANLPNITISNLTTVKTNEGKDGSVFQKFEPYKILPRVLFRGLTYPNENWGINSGQTQTWWAESYQFDRWQEINRFTTYPFSYNNFSHYINWNSEDTFDPNESVFTFQQDMYDIYYEEYINDLTSPENKIVSAKIYLTPWEIAQLRYDERILIQNNYFRINKISNYNLTEPSICDIELIKLTKDYTPHPVMYYTFVSCNPLFESLFTNSDIMFNLFAYIGRYVKVYTENKTYLGCFEVREDSYDPNRTYQHYWLTTGFTQSGVSIYEDCACTGRTSMLVVQEPPVTSPTPTPSVTPTNTPTISLTPTNTPTQSVTPTNTPTLTPTNTQTPTPSVTPPATCSCYYFFNETGGPLDISYTACGNVGTTETVPGGQNYRRCVRDFTPITVDPGITYGPCSSVTTCTTDSDCTGCS